MPVDPELIAEKDALSRDIIYHTPCLLREKRACELLDKNVDKKISDVYNVNIIAAEVEFCARIEDRLFCGEFIPLNEAEVDHNNSMKEHQLDREICRKKLKRKLIIHIMSNSHVFPTAQNHVLIHSKSVRDKAVIYLCLRELRQKMSCKLSSVHLLYAIN